MTKIVTEADVTRLNTDLQARTSSWFTSLPELDPITWSSGAYTALSPESGEAFATMRGRALGNATVFPARDKGAAGMENLWWLAAAGSVPDVAVGVPMQADDTTNLPDISATMRNIAAGMKADGRRFFIRLGWEMNLVNPSKVTDANLTLWRQRWSQYYDIFKAVLGDKGLVGFNPNEGASQSGLTGSITKAWVVGKVDWCGPDTYDWWEPFTSDASVTDHLNKTYGLNWWATTARQYGVRLAVPEWGVVSGSTAPGHRGGDNPRFITTMADFMKRNRDIMLYDSYFNEPSSYLVSDLLTNNPLARESYRIAFTTR